MDLDYQEKLRLAKEALDSGSYDKETIEYIFPELRESEDERIRKRIIEFLSTPFVKKGISEGTLSTWIAWLEKQGKQKCFDILNEEDYNEIETIAMHLENMNNEAMAVSLREILYKHKCKPSIWSEEDEKTLNSILNDLSQDVIPDDEDIQWLKSLKERMKGE